MHEAAPLRIMSALAQATRLGIVELLARAGGTGMASGDIADRLGVPRNLMSSHLTILTKAGIVEPRKTGRTVVYVLRTSVVLDLCRHLAGLVRGQDAGA